METINNEDAYYLGILAGLNFAYGLSTNTTQKDIFVYIADKILSFAPHLADIKYKANETELGSKLMASFNITPNDLSTANSK